MDKAEFRRLRTERFAEPELAERDRMRTPDIDQGLAWPGRRQFVEGALVLAALGLAGCASPPGSVTAPLTRIALASCADETKPQPIWDAVLRDHPSLMIFGGDNVYSSEQPWQLSKLEQAYALQAAVPGFARLRATVPYLAMWDDHDYGLNDGGADFPHKAASKAAFLRFWGAGAGDVRVGRDGIYTSQVYGPPGQRTQVIMLDTRWNRSPLKPTDERGKPGKERYLPDADPAKTMLGEAQWRWLEEQLREPAELRFIFSGIQILAEGHGFERWGNLPLERAKLLRLIATTGAKGVVLLSGDRHFGAMYREAAGAPYPLYEMTSSGVTHPWKEASEMGPNQLERPYVEQHYGLVEIDWTGRRVRLLLKDANGAVGRSREIPFSELQVSA